MLARTAAAFASALVTLVAFTDDAHACSPAPCTVARAVKAGTSIPAGAPALPFVHSSPSTDQVFRILGPTAAEVTTTTTTDPWLPSANLLLPSTPLVAGTGYHVGYAETCSYGPAGDVSRAFDVGPAAALPTTAGVLHAARRVVDDFSVFTSNGSCTSKIRAVAIDLRLTPSSETLAYAGVLGFKVRVDGVEADVANYGAAKNEDGDLVVLTLHAACGTRSSSDDNGPALGAHTVGVTAHVAGATTDPPELTAKVSFSCTDDGLEPDAADAGATTGTTPDAGSPRLQEPTPPPAATGAPSPETTDSGCATTGGSSPPSGAAALLLAAAIALRAKRRATRP